MSEGTLYRRRGIGMFVAGGARARLRERRRERFTEQYVEPLLAEARKLGIGHEELMKMIDSFGAVVGGDLG